MPNKVFVYIPDQLEGRKEFVERSKNSIDVIGILRKKNSGKREKERV